MVGMVAPVKPARCLGPNPTREAVRAAVERGVITEKDAAAIEQFRDFLETIGRRPGRDPRP